MLSRPPITWNLHAPPAPQDVEGVVDADGTLTVVQTRPQM